MRKVLATRSFKRVQGRFRRWLDKVQVVTRMATASGTGFPTLVRVTKHVYFPTDFR